MRILRIMCALLALVLVCCSKYEGGAPANTIVASLGVPANNEIWFTTTDERELQSIDRDAFNVPIKEIVSEYSNSIIRFEGTLTTIEDEAFRGCFNIENMSLPNSVVKIGAKVFYDCINMECLTLGSGLRECGSRAFDSCVNLTSLHIASIESWCHISFEDSAANPAAITQGLIVDGKQISHLVIPNGVESLNDYAFYNNTLLTSVEIPASLRESGRRAFYGCDGINRVDIYDIDSWVAIDFEEEVSNPLSFAEKLYWNGVKVEHLQLVNVKEISSYAFINCTTIKSLVADNFLQEIGVDAFRNCSALTTVTIGEGIKEIEERAFMGCSMLENVTIYAIEPPILGDDYVFGYNAATRKIYVPSVALEAYKNYGDWARYITSLEGVSLLES